MQPRPNDKIEIYWPDDEEYYPGTITAITPDGKHKINYDDGDRETLLLSGEKWRFPSKQQPQAQEDSELGDDEPLLPSHRARKKIAAKQPISSVNQNAKKVVKPGFSKGHPAPTNVQSASVTATPSHPSTSVTDKAAVAATRAATEAASQTTAGTATATTAELPPPSFQAGGTGAAVARPLNSTKPPTTVSKSAPMPPGPQAALKPVYEGVERADSSTAFPRKASKPAPNKVAEVEKTAPKLATRSIAPKPAQRQTPVPLQRPPTVQRTTKAKNVRSKGAKKILPAPGFTALPPGLAAPAINPITPAPKAQYARRCLSVPLSEGVLQPSEENVEQPLIPTITGSKQVDPYRLLSNKISSEGDEAIEKAVEPMVAHFKDRLAGHNTQITSLVSIVDTALPRLQSMENYTKTLRADVDNLESEIITRAELKKLLDRADAKAQKMVEDMHVTLSRQLKMELQEYFRVELENTRNDLMSEFQKKSVEMFTKVFDGAVRSMDIPEGVIEDSTIPSGNFSVQSREVRNLSADKKGVQQGAPKKRRVSRGGSSAGRRGPQGGAGAQTG